MFNDTGKCSSDKSAINVDRSIVAITAALICASLCNDKFINNAVAYSNLYVPIE